MLDLGKVIDMGNQAYIKSDLFKVCDSIINQVLLKNEKQGFDFI